MSKLSKTTFKMPVDLKIKVKQMAKSEGKTMSGLILEMINEGFETRKSSKEREFKKSIKKLQ